MSPEQMLEDCRQAVRGKGFNLNPYRLGLEVGRRDWAHLVRCPYTLPRTVRIYRSGIAYGRIYAERERQDARAAEIEGAST